MWFKTLTRQVRTHMCTLHTLTVNPTRDSIQIWGGGGGSEARHREGAEVQGSVVPSFVRAFEAFGGSSVLKGVSTSCFRPPKE